MATKKKALQAAAGAAGAGEAVYIDDIFATYLYTGNGSSQTITNDIDLADEDGLVWIKSRATKDHFLFDTERGAGNYIRSNTNDGQATDTTILSSFSSSGFSVGSSNSSNENNIDFASWTFRKAPGFFDIVTWSGNGTAGREIAHNLGCVPGMIIVKCKQSGTSWRVWHKSASTSVAILQNSNAFTTSSAAYYFGNNTSTVSPTSSVFTLGTDTDVNANGKTYVAYLFADGNSSDAQIFGDNADQDIIKCGSFTTGGAGTATVNLGFEPQFLLIKRSDASDDWRMIDNMRGFNTNQGYQFLRPNTYDGEYDSGGYEVAYVNSTGFSVDSYLYGSSYSFVYMAIRRSMKIPESGSDVFAMSYQNEYSSAKYGHYAGFPIDMAIRKFDSGSNGYFHSRLLGQETFRTDTTGTPTYYSYNKFDDMESFWSITTTDTNRDCYLWKRATGFFDMVAYDGNGSSGRTLNHSLGVVPEMIWVKDRDYGSSWYVYHKDLNVNGDNLPETDVIRLDMTIAPYDDASIWNDTAPTDSVFSLGYGNSNASNYKYFACLFASVDGVSKVGSYTGNGSATGDSQTIDCGFSTGARFVLIRRSSGTGEWFVFDTERGINAGADAYVTLQSTAAEVSGGDYIDPHSSGFTVVQHPATETNTSGETYIFYAIA